MTATKMPPQSSESSSSALNPFKLLDNLWVFLFFLALAVGFLLFTPRNFGSLYDIDPVSTPVSTPKSLPESYQDSYNSA